MPFRKASPKIHFTLLQSAEEETEPIDFPHLPSTCNTTTSRRKRFWDDESVVSSGLVGQNTVRETEDSSSGDSTKTLKLEMFPQAGKNTPNAQGTTKKASVSFEDEVKTSPNDESGMAHSSDGSPLDLWNSFEALDSGSTTPKQSIASQASETGDQELASNMSSMHIEERKSHDLNEVISVRPIAEDSEVEEDIAPVKVKLGGYIMGGFSKQRRSFSPGDVEYMKLCVKALETLLFCE